MKKIKKNPVWKQPEFSVEPAPEQSSKDMIAIRIINPCRGTLGAGMYVLYFSRYEPFDPGSRIGGRKISDWFTEDEVDMIHAEVALAQLS
jgi:hypothetical protein